MEFRYDGCENRMPDIHARRVLRLRLVCSGNQTRQGTRLFGCVRQAGETRIRRRQEQELARIRAEQEQIRREREAELKRRREDLEKRKSEESAKVTQLVEHAQGWQRSQLIREYLDALCFSAADEDGVVGIDSELAKYLRWGFEQADRCDPLRPTPPSVLDEEVDDSDLGSGGDFRPRKPR